MPDIRPDDPPDDPRLNHLWDLVEQAKDGCRASYGELYDLTFRDVHRFLLGRTRSADLADDLAAQTYANLLDKIGTVTRAAGSPVAYLIQVARNLATDHTRRAENRLTVPLADIGDALAAAGHRPTMRVDPAPATEESLVLRDGIRRLAPDQQAVLLLRFQLGYTHADTAAVLGRTEAAVKQIQCRAIRALADDAQVRTLTRH